MKIRRMLGVLGILAVASVAGAQGNTKTDLTGKWVLTVVSQGQAGTADVTLIQRGDSLIGKYNSQSLGDLEVVGTVKGKEFLFAYSTSMNNQPFTVTVKGIVQTPDSLSGTASMGALGSATFTAKRVKERTSLTR